MGPPEVHEHSLGESFLAALAEGRRTWAVGAVHGDCDRVVLLHRQLAARMIAPEDNLVYLGNFLGRGQKVRETIHELLLFRRRLLAERCGDHYSAIVYLRGSQEEMWHKLLQIQFAPAPSQVLEWMLAQGVGATLAAYGGTVDDARAAVKGGALATSRWTNRLRAALQAADGHQQLMSALKRAAYVRDRALLLVNTGIDPSRPLELQGDSFWWRAAGFDRLADAYNGFKRVVRGFDPDHRGVAVTPSTACLDGGCGFGGALFAGCFDASGELVDLIEA